MKAPKAQKAPPPEPLPQKTDAAIQGSAEAERIRGGFSGRGLAASILTGGLGDKSTKSAKGISLGGY